jgi:four helix bundle protein
MLEPSNENNLTRADVQKRMRDFALRIIRLSASLPNDRASDVLGKQVLKSGTSVGANYREAGRASSTKHFISTLEIAQREADETLYWLELIDGTGLIKSHRIEPLREECGELVAMLTASIRKASYERSNIRHQQSDIRHPPLPRPGRAAGRHGQGLVRGVSRGR